MPVATEPKTGTMAEEEGRAKVTPETETKTPAGEEVSAEAEEPKLYSQKQADALLHANDSEWGRKYKTVEKERDKYKAELADNAAEIEKLETKFSDLAKDDPAKLDVAAELKAAREERRQLKDDVRIHSEELAAAHEVTKEIQAFEIASEYESGNAVTLKSLCDAYERDSGKHISEDKMRELAGTIWVKGTTETKQLAKKPKAPISYSGKSEGGTPYFTRAQLRGPDGRKFYEEHREELLKADKEGRIQD